MSKAAKIKADKEQGHARSGSWPAFRKKHLADSCAICGSKKKLELHHVKPFHKHPELELDPANVITLCEENDVFNCHRIFGHLNNFKGWNPDILSEAKVWAQKLKDNHVRATTGEEPKKKDRFTFKN
jgi:5-methylcytosine-specific restriction endonuclease McrA